MNYLEYHEKDFFPLRYLLDGENPIWARAWDLIRQVCWDGYVIDANSPLQIRSTEVNKILTKILKLAANIQVQLIYQKTSKKLIKKNRRRAKKREQANKARISSKDILAVFFQTGITKCLWRATKWNEYICTSD